MPGTTVTFEFINPDVMAYTLEIEDEGFKKIMVYDPFVFHYEKMQQDILRFTNRMDQSSIIN